MNLSELVETARRHHERGKQIRALESEQTKDGDALLAELDRRKRTLVEHDGVTVTKASKRYGYLIDVLRERLKPSVFRKVTKLAADADALRKELKAGAVSAADLEAAEQRSRPWPVVTIVDEEQKAA